MTTGGRRRSGGWSTRRAPDQGPAESWEIRMDQSITEEVREKIDTGALPRWPAQAILSHMGRAETCDACSEKILPAEIEHELVMFDGTTLRMHVVCHGMWLAHLAWRGLWRPCRPATHLAW